MNDNRKTILTITGSDSTGESGVQADIKTIAALGGKAVSAITSITIQNTLGIQEFYDIPATVVNQQIEAVVNDVQPHIVKIGLIRSMSVLQIIVGVLRKYSPDYVIYVPTFVASNGEKLIQQEVIEAITDQLVPLCQLVITHKSQTHGENNTFASAVAFYLSEGLTVDEAQKRAGEYVALRLSKAEGLKGRASELYHAFMDLAEEHCTSNNDVAFYADRLNVSPRYLAQVCRKTAARSPKQLIDEFLVQRIETLLTTTTKNIQEIARLTGFSSQAQLSKFFKKMRGTTPTLFRNQ